MKVTIVVEKIPNAYGIRAHYKAFFLERPELFAEHVFKNQAIAELVEDYGAMVGLRYREQ